MFLAEDKLILKNKGGYPCQGYLEVYHNNTWGYVGDTHWDKNTEKVVCKSTHCGEPVENSVIDTVKPSEHRPIWLNELKCKGDESALWECKHPGWKSSHYSKLTVKKLKCSSKFFRFLFLLFFCCCWWAFLVSSVTMTLS